MDNKELTKTEFNRIQALIYQMCGIRIPEKKKTLLSNRLRPGANAGNHESFGSYIKHLEEEPTAEEVTELLNAVTTNETSFFRTQKHFDWLGNEFLSELIAQARQGKRSKQIRIWSAASSTGEEAYSIAMSIAENKLRLRDWKIDIFASDLSQEVIRKAQKGLFGKRSISSLDDKRVKRYFRELADESKWQLKPTIREMVSFRQHNLMEPWKGTLFDCVFLRNVMIYFDEDSKRQVVENLTNAIRKGGYLVVGPSEGVFDMLPSFTKHSTFLYQK